MLIEPKLVPKNSDGILRVIIPGRISTPHQDEASIEASQEDNETWLKRVYHGPLEILNVGEQASGWLVDRPSMTLALSLIEGDKIDLVLMGEVRELYRNPRLQWGFVQDCIDFQTRMIARWDNVDTAKEDWELSMHLAVVRHGMTVPEARRRVRRKSAYTFSRGGMVLKIKYGYRKLSKEQAQSGEFGPVGLRIMRVEDCTVWILEMRRRVLDGHTDAMVARWLNEQGVPTGPYVTSKKWTARLVRELLKDAVLSGRRRFLKSIGRIVYRSGKPKSMTNPTPQEAEEYPGLAHMTIEQQNELMAYYAARRTRNSNVQKTGRNSPLWNVPRNQSLWPGQSLRCSVCGNFYYQCGKELKCKNALPGTSDECWNHVIVNMETLRERVLPLLWDTIISDPTAKKIMVGLAWRQYQQSRRGSTVRLAAVQNEIKLCQQKIARQNKLLDYDADLVSVAAELSKAEKRLKALRKDEKTYLDEDSGGTVYTSAEDIDRSLITILDQMARTSREFGVLLRKLITEASIVPVQSLDCPQVRPRLKLTISFAAFAKDPETAFRQEHVLDLFKPPVHVLHLQACLAAKMANPKWSLKKIEAETGINYMTVKRAFDYVRRMEREGLTEPYRVLTAKPATASRWRPHRRKPGMIEDDTFRGEVRKAS